jgi:transcriptional regulator with XRE-family HTH domain
MSTIKKPFANPTSAHVNRVKKQLSEIIYDERTKLGISQEKLADLVGIDRKTINRIENGHFSPSIDTLVRIFVVLNIPSARVFEIKK